MAITKYGTPRHTFGEHQAIKQTPQLQAEEISKETIKGIKIKRTEKKK